MIVIVDIIAMMKTRNIPKSFDEWMDDWKLLSVSYYEILLSNKKENNIDTHDKMNIQIFFDEI